MPGLPPPPIAMPAVTPPAIHAPQVPSAAGPEQLRNTARKFEAATITQMLQPMFNTVNTSKGLFGGKSGEEAWKPLLVEEIAKKIAAHGGLGLAKPIYEAMTRMQKAKTK